MKDGTLTTVVIQALISPMSTPIPRPAASARTNGVPCIQRRPKVMAAIP